MIVQTAAPGRPHFIIRQTDHARMSGQLAAAFGNARFAPLEPREAMVFIVAHHDEGWEAIDAKPGRDPKTGLPWHLTQTPMAALIASGARSPEFNARFHPVAGLISSMHTWGLWNGRYGLSDRIIINNVPAEVKPAAMTMLDGELARQVQLKARISADPREAHLALEAWAFHNYKLLQFFDTLALYFHLTHPEARTEASFLNVPQGVNDDVTVTVRPRDGAYVVSPWPFAGDELIVSTPGCWMTPLPEGSDIEHAYRYALTGAQIERLVAP
jgi:hypothetical protein